MIANYDLQVDSFVTSNTNTMFVYKNGKWINERSPFVDDIRDIIDEYPYFELDCYKVVHKDYKFKKKELANLKVSDVSEFKKPDLDNSELYPKAK